MLTTDTTRTGGETTQTAKPVVSILENPNRLSDQVCALEGASE
ncbi:hypothetical protein HCTV-16_gp128 [Haloarcula virus HCTV-16]|nr:hypothetical protein HCTV-16_gp128 [Haloarcula virus HCTV-16]